MQRLQYQPALDGIRAIAILPVMAIHSLAPHTLGGFIGVDIFFVLSGFLITSLLLAEHHATGRIDLGAFYLRRARRLYPTLILVVVAYLALADKFFPEDEAIRDSMVALFYLSDYARAFWGFPHALQQTWSLAVEEHFYVLWPFVVPLLARARKPAKYLFLAYLVATIWRIANVHWLGYAETYFRFDTRLSGILLGSALAMGRTDSPLKSALLPILIILAILPSTRYASDFGLTAAIVLAEVAAVFLIGAASNPLHPFLAHRAMVYLGKLSYGIYLWHFPIFLWIREHHGWREVLLIGLPMTLVLAALTYHFVDIPLRRMRFPWKLRKQNPAVT